MFINVGVETSQVSVNLGGLVYSSQITALYLKEVRLLDGKSLFGKQSIPYNYKHQPYY